MFKAMNALAAGKVVLLTGRTTQPLLERHVRPRFPCEQVRARTHTECLVRGCVL